MVVLYKELKIKNYIISSIIIIATQTVNSTVKFFKRVSNIDAMVHSSMCTSY